MGKGDVLNTLKNYKSKNSLLNGNMQTWQKGTSFTGITSSGTLLASRFINEFGGSLSGNIDVARSTDVPSGKEFEYSMKITNQTAIGSIGAADTCAIYQKVIWGNIQQLIGKRVSFSCWVKTNKPGKYNFFIFAGSSTYYCMAANVTLSNSTWEKVTFRSATALPSNISPTGLAGGIVGIHLAAGSNYYGDPTDWVSNQEIRGSASNVNFCDTVGNEFYMTGIQAIDSEDEDGEFRLHTSSDEEEKDACDAYFQRFNTSQYTFLCSGYARNTTEGEFRLDYKREMIAIPTITVSSPTHFGLFNNPFGGGKSITIMNPGFVSKSMTNIYTGGSSGLTSGGFYFIRSVNTSGYIDLNAEI